jgi:hypothetical protein
MSGFPPFGTIVGGLPSGAFGALNLVALDLSLIRGLTTPNPESLWRGQIRMIDPGGYGLIPQVTIDEDADDELIITEHPVEYGAAITDHAYKRPAEVRLRLGWSNAYIGDVRLVYEQIQALQLSRKPFLVFTGKRIYQNMLIASLRTHTDAKLEYSFIADIVFRQIILVSTQTLPASANPQNLGSPQQNQPSADTGPVQPQPVPDTSIPDGTVTISDLEAH